MITDPVYFNNRILIWPQKKNLNQYPTKKLKPLKILICCTSNVQLI
jgi:hypothetical protein